MREPPTKGTAVAAAVVVGLDCITGLQTARILAERGIPVIGVASDLQHFCCKTRVCQKIVEADTSTPDLINTLVQLTEESEIDLVVYPCTDASVLVLSDHRSGLPQRFKFALPDAGTVRTLMDKVQFIEFAIEHNIPIPQTFLLRDRADAEQASQALKFPCIVKPPMKSPGWFRQTTAKAFKVNDPVEFMRLYDECHEWTDILMAQQWVSGEDDSLFSCNCYFSSEGKSLVHFIARKIRQWPPETGTSCLGEEVRNDAVLESTLALFESVGYRGLGYVEMKRDAETGIHYVIEPNIGRPTGRSAISEAGGVELLYTMYCDLTGQRLPDQRNQTYQGVKWIYWRNDLRSAWHYWRCGDTTLLGVLRSWRGKKACAVFSWRDPIPFFADFWRSFGMALRGFSSRWKLRAVD